MQYETPKKIQIEGNMSRIFTEQREFAFTAQRLNGYLSNMPMLLKDEQSKHHVMELRFDLSMKKKKNHISIILYVSSCH